MIRSMLINRGFAALMALALPLSGAGAQDFPSKPIRFIAPFPAGGSSDLHVPYKGTGQSINDLLGAQIHAVFASMPVAYPHVRTCKLRALASTSPERTALAPELPTMIEAGVPGFVSESWWGVFVPARTPAAIVRKLGDVIARIVPEAQSRERFAALGIEPLKLSPAELAALVCSELASYGKIVKEVGIAGL
jgi:tripartite-type tricarboxylate transporter receptor subunit TctC